MQTGACGPTGFLLIFLAIAGFVASLLATLLAWIARHPAARFVSPGTVLLGAVTLAIAARAQPQGCAVFGMQAGVLPLTAGAVATARAFLRRRQP